MQGMIYLMDQRLRRVFARRARSTLNSAPLADNGLLNIDKNGSCSFEIRDGCEVARLVRKARPKSTSEYRPDTWPEGKDQQQRMVRTVAYPWAVGKNPFCERPDQTHQGVPAPSSFGKAFLFSQ